MTPVVFGPSERQLLGMHHAPDPARAVGAGVVLCNPLGYEAMCAHRTYRHLARRLAAAGFDVLRFDYHGTGDSSGRSDDPDRLRAWLDSIGAAVEELRAIAGVTTVDLFGVRLGATLATLAAGERRDIRSLVLWAPTVSGRAYVREVRALQMLKRGSSDPAQVGKHAGELYGPALQDLSTVSLLALRDRVAARALVLPRDDLPGGESQLVAHLRERGTDAELRVEPGYAGMMDHPETAVVPSQTLDAIVSWMLRPESVPAPGPTARPSSTVLATWSHAPRRPVREEAVSFGDGRRLFGVVTEGDERSRGRTAVLFLNAGANHRVGPNRLHVSLARELAARGVPALRFDASGIGDGAPAPGVEENRLYSKDAVVDVQAAMSFLEETRGVDRFVLVGICSGGFLAFHTSVTDSRVAGQILINPQTFDWKEGDSLLPSSKRSFKSTRYYLQALWRPSIWTLALRGELALRDVAGELGRRSTARVAGRLKAAMARARSRSEPRSEVERAFRSVSARGARSLLVFSAEDGGLDMIEEQLGSGAGRMRGQAGFRLEIVDGADHTFTPREAQEELRRIVTRFVDAVVADSPAEARLTG